MASIRLNKGNGFQLIPEGTHVFKIMEVEYKEKFGTLAITMQTKGGQKHVERFYLTDKEGNENERALNAFSYFAKTVLNDFSLEAIDDQDLLGKFIKCQVNHREGSINENTGRPYVNVNLGDKYSANGFEETGKQTANGPAKGVVDLDALV